MPDAATARRPTAWCARCPWPAATPITVPRCAQGTLVARPPAYAPSRRPTGCLEDLRSVRRRQLARVAELAAPPPSRVVLVPSVSASAALDQRGARHQGNGRDVADAKGKRPDATRHPANRPRVKPRESKREKAHPHGQRAEALVALKIAQRKTRPHPHRGRGGDGSGTGTTVQGAPRGALKTCARDDRRRGDGAPAPDVPWRARGRDAVCSPPGHAADRPEREGGRQGAEIAGDRESGARQRTRKRGVTRQAGTATTAAATPSGSPGARRVWVQADSACCRVMLSPRGRLGGGADREVAVS